MRVQIMKRSRGRNGMHRLKGESIRVGRRVAGPRHQPHGWRRIIGKARRMALHPPWISDGDSWSFLERDDAVPKRPKPTEPWQFGLGTMLLTVALCGVAFAVTKRSPNLAVELLLASGTMGILFWQLLKICQPGGFRKAAEGFDANVVRFIVMICTAPIVTGLMAAGFWPVALIIAVVVYQITWRCTRVKQQ